MKRILQKVTICIVIAILSINLLVFESTTYATICEDVDVEICSGSYSNGNTRKSK